MGHRESGIESFPPHVLREYALPADGERGIVVGPRGDFCWMCVPRWDSDAVFASLVGAPGVYAVTPRERFVWGGAYDPGSLIWTCRWVTSVGIIECREALAFPGDPEHAVILRRIVARVGARGVRPATGIRPAGDGHATPHRGTTSLPERSEAGHNYDYRYVWIRDQCYAGQAAAAAYPLLDDAVRFVAARVLADGPHLKPAYPVLGRPAPTSDAWTCPAIRAVTTGSATM
jgi:hypothetical protein